MPLNNTSRTSLLYISLTPFTIHTTKAPVSFVATHLASVKVSRSPFPTISGSTSRIMMPPLSLSNLAKGTLGLWCSFDHTKRNLFPYVWNEFAFDREAIGPAMYFGLMGDGQPIGRYDDMLLVYTHTPY